MTLLPELMQSERSVDYLKMAYCMQNGTVRTNAAESVRVMKSYETDSVGQGNDGVEGIVADLGQVSLGQPKNQPSVDTGLPFVPISTVHMDTNAAESVVKKSFETQVKDLVGLGNDAVDGIMEQFSLDQPKDQPSLDTGLPWIGGEVPYTVSNNFSSTAVQTINIAIQEFNRQVKSVQWIERRKNEVNYVMFVCCDESYSSHIGCMGGCQKIFLPRQPILGKILHEMGHAIGLLHEQCRIEFIKVNKNIIENGREHNFKVMGIPLGKYDCNSIMHYSGCAFSKFDGRRTIEVIQPEEQDSIGQRNTFSESDLKGIEELYGPLKCSADRFGEEALQSVCQDEDLVAYPSNISLHPQHIVQQMKGAAPPLPATIDDIDFSGEWSKTNNDELFLQVSRDNILMFATENNLKVLSERTTIYCDGTFSVCPRLFYQ